MIELIRQKIITDDIFYQDNLSLSRVYEFGVEIEFYNVFLEHLAKEAERENLNIKYVLDHKTNVQTFDKWYLDYDSSVTDIATKFGGELSSKIMTDSYSNWQNLRTICEFLRKNNATINNKCSLHIHIGTSNFINNNSFFEVFSKIMALYENEFITFYRGDYYKLRETFYEYAKPLNPNLIDVIDKIDFYTSHFLYTLMYCSNPALFTARYGINLQSIKDNGTIEIRYPSGTLKEEIIQNNINFSLKLIDSILNNKWDIDKLDFLITKKKNNINYPNNIIFSDNNISDFTMIVDKISKNDIDKNNFINQYQKVLKNIK